MRRVGLFGGSFDPVHNAHLALAKLALDELMLDELRWIPAGRPWQKARAPTDAAHRVAMLRLATAGEPRHVIDQREIAREGPSYTIDTVLELQAQERAEWFLLIGQDQYAGLPSWHRWRELLPLVTFAVAGRAGQAPHAPPALAALPHRARTLPLPAMMLSATEIRARAARGEPLDALVPPAVARYIESNHLYRS
jgi:nicotinate-nucleotide adenylyltransferase